MWPFASGDDYGGESEHTSIFDFLKALDKHNNVLRAVALGKDVAPAWKQDEEHSWGDVFGIPQGEETDDWAPWLAKEGSRFALDAVLDLNNLLPPVKIAKWLAKGASNTGRLAKLETAIQGSGLAKRTGHRLWGKQYEPIEEAITEIDRLGRVPIIDGEDQLTNFSKLWDPFEGGVRKTILDSGGTEADIGKKIGSEFWHGYETGGAISPELQPIKDALEGLHQTRTGVRDALKANREAFGQTTLDDVMVEGQYLPHRFTPKESRLAGDYKKDLRIGSIDYEPTTGEKSRELYKWVDWNDDLLLHRSGHPLLTRADDPRGGIISHTDPTGKKVYFRGDKDKLKVTTKIDPFTGKPGFYDELGNEIPQAFPRQASLAEKMDIVDPAKFKVNPGEVLFDDLKELQKQNNFYEMLKKLQDVGAIGTKETNPDFLSLGLKGFENYGAKDKAILNRLQNLGVNALGKDVLENMPWDYQLLDNLVNSKAGKALSSFTNWWKRNTLLGSPGFHFGNMASNQGLLYGGEVPAWKIPFRDYEALKIQKGFGGDVLEGMSNADLLKEMRLRSSSGDIERLWSQANQDPRTAERVREYVPLIGDYIAEPAQKVANAIGKVNQFGANVARGIEDNSTLALVVDYVKRNAPNFGALSPEEKAKLLDRASMYAENKMVRYAADYRNVPMYERNLSKIIPFYQWTRGMLGQTGSHLYNNPARLNRMGMGLETVFQPLSGDEYQIAPDNIKESGPVVGMFGKSFDDMADSLGLPMLDNGRRMFQLQRFLPWGTAEQFYHRPTETLGASVNPFIKTPIELLANRDTFKNREIDPIAKGFMESLYAPLTSGMYTPEEAVNYGMFQLPAGWAKIAQVMPWARHSNELQTLGRDVLWSDPYKQEMAPIEKALWYLTGGKAYPFDEFKAYQMKKKQLQDRVNSAKHGLKVAATKGYDPAVEKYIDMISALQGRGPLGF